MLPRQERTVSSFFRKPNKHRGDLGCWSGKRWGCNQGDFDGNVAPLAGGGLDELEGGGSGLQVGAHEGGVMAIAGGVDADADGVAEVAVVWVGMAAGRVERRRWAVSGSPRSRLWR